MIYSKNYDKKEIIVNYDISRADKLPDGWEKIDTMKVLGDEEYPIDKEYKILLEIK